MFYGEWSTSQRLRRCRTGTIFQSVVGIDLTEKATQDRHDHGHGMIFGVGREIVHYAIGTGEVLCTDGSLQFEHVKILANANVFFDVLRLNLGTFGQDDSKFFQFIHHFAQIIAQVFCQDLRCLS